VSLAASGGRKPELLVIQRHDHLGAGSGRVIDDIAKVQAADQARRTITSTQRSEVGGDQQAA
jgi:hypothetical protein